MTSFYILKQILKKCGERYVSQFESEIFDSLLWDSTKCAPWCVSNSFVTMATYWVPDLPNIKGFSGHLWWTILMFANSASSTWSSQHINMLAQVHDLISSFLSWKSLMFWINWVGTGKDWVAMGMSIIFYSCRCVACITISLSSYNCLCCKFTMIALFIYLM